MPIFQRHLTSSDDIWNNNFKRALLLKWKYSMDDILNNAKTCDMQINVNIQEICERKEKLVFSKDYGGYPP